MEKKILPIVMSIFLLSGCSSSTATSTETATLPSPTETTAPTPTPTEGLLVSGPTIEVPQGTAPTIDGILSPGEWYRAFTDELSDGSELMMMHSNGYLYLGIRSRVMSVGSICTLKNEQVWILHSSAALGNAVYEKTDGGWHQIEGFSWCCRATTPNLERDDFLKENGWMASIAFMGISNEMEYQIAMEDGTLTLAVTSIFNRFTIPYWPQTLEDDCRLYEVADGAPPESVQFDIDAWVTVLAAPTSE